MRLGVANVEAKYNVGAANQVLGNALDQIDRLGPVGTVKMYLTPNFKEADYKLQDWGVANPTNLVQLAQTAPMVAALARPYPCLQLTCFTFCNADYSQPAGKYVTNDWRISVLTDRLVAIYDEMKAFATWALAHPAFAGRRIVIQNWEGDWQLPDRAGPITPGGRDFPNINREMVAYYIGFLSARQRAISDARKGTASTVQLLHAIECNRVIDSRTNPERTRLVTHVLGEVRPDVVSLSAYEPMIDHAIGFGSSFAQWEDYSLPRITKAKRIIDNSVPTGTEVQIGETGFPEKYLDGGGAVKDQYVDNARDVGDMVNSSVAHCDTLGFTDYVYWQALDNEYVDPNDHNKGPRGFYTTKPDGNLSRAGLALQALL